MDSPVPSECDATGGGSEEDEEAPAVNPAPPSDAAAVLHSDAIGDTLYSERGVLRTLMALNAAVPRYLGLPSDGAGGGGDVRDAGDSVGTARRDCGGRVEAVVAGGGGAAGVEHRTGYGGEIAAVKSETMTEEERSDCGPESEPALMELDGQLEQELCQLWDMTAERAVAEFVAGSGLLEVAWPLLGRSPCPRLLEIVAGTLANCAGHGVAALPGGADTAASAAGLLLANSRGDPPLLRETLRLVQAAACAQPEPERLLRELSGWLPLLCEVLRGALSAPLLRQTLGLLTAVAELRGRRRWWLAELAAADRLPESVLEGLAQLVSGDAAGVTAEDMLDCCRDSLVLLAEVETLEGAAKPEPGQSAWRGRRCGDRCLCAARLGSQRCAFATVRNPRGSCCGPPPGRLLCGGGPRSVQVAQYWLKATHVRLQFYAVLLLYVDVEVVHDTTGRLVSLGCLPMISGARHSSTHMHFYSFREHNLPVSQD